MEKNKKRRFVLLGIFLSTIIAVFIIYYSDVIDDESKGIILSTYEQCIDTNCDCGHLNSKGKDVPPRWVKREDILTEEIYFIHQCGECCMKCRMNVRPIPAKYLMDRGIVNNPIIDLPYPEYPYPTEFIFR